VTAREIARHLAQRQKRARQIIDRSEQFKVCSQCQSILYRGAGTCSVCGAYRFHYNPALVRKTAARMGGNPFPVTSGTVPRLAVMKGSSSD